MDHSFKFLSSGEILSVLEKASLFGGRVQQSASLSNFSSTILKVDVDASGTLFIKLSERGSLEDKKPLSVNLNYRNISFYLTPSQFSLEGDVIVGQAPQEARGLAIRDSDRHAFPLNSQTSGVFHRAEKRAITAEIEGRLVDVSQRGLGFTLASLEEDLLKANDHLWIKSLAGVELERKIFARVVYVFERQFKNTSELKAGLFLDERLPENVFEELKEQCKLVLKA